MMGAGGVQFIPLTKFSQTDTLLDLLRGGQLVRGRVVSGETQPALLVGGHRISLPAELPVSPGQWLTVRLVERNGRQTLDIRPGPAPGSQAPPAAKTLEPILQRVVDALGGAARTDQAVALAPKSVPLRQDDLAAIMRLFINRQQTGHQLGRLVAVLEQAAASAALSPNTIAHVRTLARQFRAETAGEFQNAVRAARDTVGRPLEHRLAALIAHGQGRSAAPVRQHLVAELMQLRQDPAVRGALEQAGLWREFAETAEGVLERLQGARLQNVRAHEMPYQFIELPMGPETGIEHAQVHFFGDESGGGIGGKRAHLVVLDLQMSRLGGLWVAVQSTGTNCHCVMRVESGAAREALDADANHLRDAIKRAGFAAVRVQTEAWDGDRLSAAAALMSRMDRFEVRV